MRAFSLHPPPPTHTPHSHTHIPQPHTHSMTTATDFQLQEATAATLCWTKLSLLPGSQPHTEGHEQHMAPLTFRGFSSPFQSPLPGLKLSVLRLPGHYKASPDHNHRGWARGPGPRCRRLRVQESKHCQEDTGFSPSSTKFRAARR